MGMRPRRLYGVWMTPHYHIKLWFVSCLSDTSVTDSAPFFSALSSTAFTPSTHFFHPIEDTNAFITAQVFRALRQCLFFADPPTSSFPAAPQQSFLTESNLHMLREGTTREMLWADADGG